MKKFIDAVCLVADLAPGIALTVAGIAVIVAAQTGAFWQYA